MTGYGLGYYTLLSVKRVEGSERHIQHLLNRVAIPSAVLANCLNLQAVLTYSRFGFAAFCHTLGGQLNNSWYSTSSS